MVLKDLGYIFSIKKLPTEKNQAETIKINSDNLKIYFYLYLFLNQQNAVQIELISSQDGFAVLEHISAKYKKKNLLHSARTY